MGYIVHRVAGLDTVEQMSMYKHLGKAESLSKSISLLTECRKKGIISNGFLLKP